MVNTSLICRGQVTGQPQSRQNYLAYRNGGLVKVGFGVKSTSNFSSPRKADQRSKERFLSGSGTGNSRSQTLVEKNHQNKQCDTRAKSGDDVVDLFDPARRGLLNGSKICALSLRRHSRNRHSAAYANDYGLRHGIGDGVRCRWSDQAQVDPAHGCSNRRNGSNVGRYAQPHLVLSHRVCTSVQPILRRSGNRGDGTSLNLRERRVDHRSLNHTDNVAQTLQLAGCGGFLRSQNTYFGQLARGY